MLRCKIKCRVVSLFFSLILSPFLSLSSAANNGAELLHNNDSTDFVFPRQRVIDIALKSAPFLVTSSLVAESDLLIHKSREYSFPNFRYRYDDYLQYTPMLMQVSMGMLGLKGRSDNRFQLLTADAMAGAVTATLVMSTKYLIGRLRPDGSVNNSFPSGHTATAFLGAELFDIEYGDSYPWLSAICYSAAAFTGYGRILNNRHWGSDVLAGAGVGILSAHMGYWLSDLIYGRSSKEKSDRFEWNTQDIFLVGYRSSSGTLFRFQQGASSFMRSEIALLFPLSQKEDFFAYMGGVGGYIADLGSKEVNPQWYGGLNVEYSFPIFPRFSYGLSGHCTFAKPHISMPEASMQMEMGGKLFCDYKIRKSRSIRLYGGLASGYGIVASPYEDEESQLRYSHLLLELGVSLCLHF